MKISLIVATLLITVVSMACTALKAAEMKVTLDKVEGSVEAQATEAAAWKSISSGDTVPIGATVRTKADGSCIVKWAGGNVAKVGALSVIKVSEADRGAGGKENSTLDLKEGKVFAHAKKLATPDSTFMIRTPTAIAGVRGTELYGMMEGGQSSFGVTEGTIAVEAGGVEVMVEQGMSVAIDPGGAISEPAPIPPEIRQQVNQNMGEVRETAKQDMEKSEKEETKEEKKEEKAEEKDKDKEEASGGKEEVREEAGAETEADTDMESTVDDTIDRIMDEETTSNIVDEVEQIYRTGTVDVIIYLDEPSQ